MAQLINSLEFNENIGVFSTPFAICESSASATDKTVDVQDFAIEPGATILVKFVNGISYTGENYPMLLLYSNNDYIDNSRGYIFYNADYVPSDKISANNFYQLIYYDTKWNIVGGLDDFEEITDAEIEALFNASEVSEQTEEV